MSAVLVRDAGNKGRGVFATRSYIKGDLIEECPVLVLDAQDRDIIDKTKLYNYYYAWGDDGELAAIALGYGSLYNHSYTPNARYERDEQKDVIRIVALVKIKAEDEITVNYNGKPDDTSKLWFDVHE